MFTVLLLALLGACIECFRAYRKSSPSRDEYVAIGVLGAVIGGVAGVVVCFAASFFLPWQTVASAPREMVAMRSSDGVSGSFIFGSGSVNNTLTYRFMLKEGDGGMTPGSVDADQTVHIYEDSGLSNRGSWTVVRRKMDVSQAVVNWFSLGVRETVVVRNEFRVPVGTVVQQFSVK